MLALIRLTKPMLLGFSLLCAVSSAPAQEPKKIRVGYPAISTTQSHIWVGHEAGLFRKHGLDVEPIFLRGVFPHLVEPLAVEAELQMMGAGDVGGAAGLRSDITIRPCCAQDRHRLLTRRREGAKT